MPVYKYGSSVPWRRRLQYGLGGLREEPRYVVASSSLLSRVYVSFAFPPSSFWCGPRFCPPRRLLVLMWGTGIQPDPWLDGASRVFHSCSPHPGPPWHSHVRRAYMYLPFTSPLARAERERLSRSSPSINGKNTPYPFTNISRRLLSSSKLPTTFVCNAALLGSSQSHNLQIDRWKLLSSTRSWHSTIPLLSVPPPWPLPVPCPTWPWILQDRAGSVRTWTEERRPPQGVLGS